MGISKKNLTKLDFLTTQGYWGHQKNRSNGKLNKYFLGSRNDFTVFNPECSIEYSKRSILFCSKATSKGGNLIFVSSDDTYKELVIFFGCRSLQLVHYDKWSGGFLTNNPIDKPYVLIISTTSKNASILKEASRKLIPVICVEDSDYSLDKPIYSILGNDGSKQFFHSFYSILTNNVLKSLMHKHCINLIT